MKIRVLVERVILSIIVFFAVFLSITSSPLWILAFWAISGVLACFMSKAWNIFMDPFDFDKAISTMIVGCLGGLMLFLTMATEHEISDKVSRTPQ